VTIEWACAFCDRSTGDDPRNMELGVDFASGDGPSQFFHAHFECLRNALHITAQAELLDPLDESS
jgi:hypothetical protein